MGCGRQIGGITMTATRTLLGEYPHHGSLRTRAVRSPLLDLQIADAPVIHAAFKRVVREFEFDFAELALVTFLQACAHDKPLRMVPVVLFNQPYPQQAALVCRVNDTDLVPQRLAGKRVGCRALSVTTVMWVRGILQHEYGLSLPQVTWVTAEDAHVAEAREPAGTQRAPGNRPMLEMLLAGELDAAILAGPDLRDPRVRPVIPNPDIAAQIWQRDHGFEPVNHILVVSTDFARSVPNASREMVNLLAQARDEDTQRSPVRPEPFRLSSRALTTAIEYAYEQALIPRRLAVDEIVDPATRDLLQ